MRKYTNVPKYLSREYNLPTNIAGDKMFISVSIHENL